MLLDVQQWMLEILKAFARLLVNPLFYWSILLLVIVGSRRINRERRQFGFKIFPMFYEIKNTWLSSIIFGILLSALFIVLEIIFPLPTLILLLLSIVLFSIHMKLTLLSASYTIGLTFLLIILSPFVLRHQGMIDPALFSNTPLMGLGLLTGFLLCLEAYYLLRERRNNTFPQLVKSERGLWIGQHQLKKLSIIPIFFLVPSEQLSSILSFLPYTPQINEPYSLFLFPMLIGYDLPVKSTLATEKARRLSLYIGFLGIAVLLLAIGSIYLFWLNALSIIVAIVGREFIVFKHRSQEQLQTGLFTRHKNGLQVLSVMPHSPAERLGISTGELIVKVNGLPIQTVDEFYKALQRSGANYRLDVVDEFGEIRIVQSALFAGEHYKLGLIFVDDPYDKRDKQLQSFSNIN